MNDNIFLGVRLYIDRELCMVISEIDENGYFMIELEDYNTTQKINISQVVLNGYSFTGMPIMRFSIMDYDLGI